MDTGGPERIGITATELADHAKRYGSADPAELQRWLLHERLAETREHVLVPTPLALEIALALDLDLG